MIYLDNAATTFHKPESVYRAMDYAMRNYSVNIGRGSYRLATEAQSKYEELKFLLCSMVKLTPNNNHIVFSPSATMAANQIIHGLEFSSESIVYYSPFEHNAIVRPLEMKKKLIGFETIEIPFTSDQELDVAGFKHLLTLKPATHIFATHISNVTGVILDIELIREMTIALNTIMVIDASQSLGLVEIDMFRNKYDYLIFAGHKTLYGPFGIGGIISTKINLLTPFFQGGTGSDSLNVYHQSHEVGSQNIVAVAGLLAGVRWINEIGIERILKHERDLRLVLSDSLSEIYGLKIYSSTMENTTGILAFNLDGYKPDELGMILDQDFNIMVRSGYQCAPYIHGLIGTKEKNGVIRISIGNFNTISDIEEVIQSIRKL